VEVTPPRGPRAVQGAPRRAVQTGGRPAASSTGERVSSSRRRELACAARFVFEVGYLKRLPRFGATYAGVGGDETVAAHSFRTAVIAGVLAAAEGLDVARASLMALVHDLPETRTGDLNLVQKRYLQRSVPP